MQQVHAVYKSRISNSVRQATDEELVFGILFFGKGTAFWKLSGNFLDTLRQRADRLWRFFSKWYPQDTNQ